jgi:hypothetical protein
VAPLLPKEKGQRRSTWNCICLKANTRKKEVLFDSSVWEKKTHKEKEEKKKKK